VAAFIQFLHHRQWPSLGSETLGTLEAPTIRFRWGTRFRDFLVRFRYDLPDCSPPFGGSDRVAPATGDFYFRAFDNSVTLLVAGYNYGGKLDNFRRWDFHPQEQQLASLHQTRACTLMHSVPQAELTGTGTGFHGRDRRGRSNGCRRRSCSYAGQFIGFPRLLRLSHFCQILRTRS
jgi:hypothetical protein